MNPESRSTPSLIPNLKTQTRTFQLVPRLGEDQGLTVPAVQIELSRKEAKATSTQADKLPSKLSPKREAWLRRVAGAEGLEPGVLEECILWLVEAEPGEMRMFFDDLAKRGGAGLREWLDGKSLLKQTKPS